MHTLVFLAASPNDLIPKLVAIGIIVLLLGIGLKILRQPYIVAYIVAGVFLGKDGFGIMTDQGLIDVMGELGLILLLFFIGMEISLPAFVKRWQVPVFGTFMQIIASIALVGLIGYFLNWELTRVLTIGFVISLSSSAVVIKLLQDRDETKTPIGQNVVSILLMQDILIVPMLITINTLGGQSMDTGATVKLILGGIILVALIFWIIKKETLHLPFRDIIEKDHELQVILALSICLGCSAATAWFGISSALGAFVGGMIVHSFQSTHWFHDSLHSFRVLFVAVFFISIGMLIDLQFIFEHWSTILLLLVAIYASNHLLNAVVLYYLTRSWRLALYGGALLGQIGELSFVLSAAAYHTDIIGDFTYQLVIVIIALSLLFSPIWITLSRRFLNRQREPISEIIDS